MGSGERSVSRRRVTAGAEGHREGFVPDHPRIAVLGSRSTFTAHAVSTLCARGVPPVALMGDADPAPRARGEIPVEVRTPAARIAAAHGIALIRSRTRTIPTPLPRWNGSSRTFFSSPVCRTSWAARRGGPRVSER